MEQVNSSNDLVKLLKPLEEKMRYSAELKLLFSAESMNMIKNSYSIMKDQLGFVADNKSIRASTVQVDHIKKVSFIIVDTLIEKPVTEYSLSFIPGYVDLISNWNNQIGRCDEIGQNMRVSKRLISSQMTMDDMIGVARGLIAKLRNERSYRPAAYEFSRHYLIELQKNIADKNKGS